VSGLLRHRLVLAVLVILVLGGLFEVAGVSHSVSFSGGTPPHQAQRAPVSLALQGCPGPGSSGPTSSGIALASAPSAAPGAVAAGQAEVIPLTTGGSSAAAAAQRVVRQPGRLTMLSVPAARALPKKTAAKLATVTGSVTTVPGRGGVTIQATGQMSQGLEAEQTGSHGLATARCQSPGTSFWFAGPGTKTVAQLQLYLMNVDSQPADIQVSALTEGIPLAGGADIGIAVPPHGMVVQSLSGLLRGTTVVALHVSASAGLIVAALRESKRGTEPGTWLPPAAAPATRLVLPSIPGTPGSRELYVAVPGSQDAQVKLTAVTSRGSYQPTGGSGIALPGSSASGIPLPSLAGTPAALVVTANVPVTAAMLVGGGSDGSPGAVTAGAGPVQQQGVIADNPGSAAGSAELVLSAPRTAAAVRVTVTGQKSAIDAGSGGTVQIAAGHSVAVRLHPPRGAARTAPFSVVITPLPGSGPVYAGRVIIVRSVVQAILPVVSSPTWVPLPPVRDSLAAVLGGAQSPAG
jgi:hypothetical protein